MDGPGIVTGTEVPSPGTDGGALRTSGQESVP